MSDITDPIKTKEAKQTTMKAMIIAALWIGGLTLIKGVLIVFDKTFLEMNDIVFSGLTIAGVFSPVVISIWLDKIKAIREVAYSTKEEK